MGFSTIVLQTRLLDLSDIEDIINERLVHVSVSLVQHSGVLWIQVSFLTLSVSSAAYRDAQKC